MSETHDAAVNKIWRYQTENEKRHNFKTRDEYIKALESWVNEARIWQNISSCFPYYLMVNNILQSSNENSFTFNTQTEQTTPNEQPQTQEPHEDITTELNENEGVEFVIPPVWKRIVAEGLDFLILFVLKLALTLLALEIIDTSNWQFLREDLISNIAELHFGTEITTGILILEGLHRIIVCIYEVYWLSGTNELRYGCATPGKALLGLTVIVCTKIRFLDNRNRQTVLVYPAKDLGVLVALGRSFIKNIILAIMFPFSFAFFLFQYNRTGYDIVCNTLVVEYNPNPPRRIWQ